MHVYIFMFVCNVCYVYVIDSLGMKLLKNVFRCYQLNLTVLLLGMS